MGAVRPPAAVALAAASRREQQGFDAVWWADHFLHWFPLSIWTPELVPQAAAGQASPHVWFDPVPMVAAAAATTRNLRLGIGVTDMVRRHPASLAQTALTLDHLTGGRFMLGVGSGEALNLEPFGMRNPSPLGVLEEGLEVLQLLMSTTDAVDFQGEHFRLQGASLGLPPFGERPPPVWIAAHRPRGLRLVGRRADGWLPFATDPQAYAAMLGQVRAAAQAAGRAADEIVPGLYARIVVAETAEAALAAIDGSLLMRFIALTRPSEAYEAHGAEHPLGAGEFGLTSFLPTRYERDEARRLAQRVPTPVLRETVIHGTPDDVARQIEAFVAAGADHVQLTNMTPLADPSLAATSEALLGDAVVALRAGRASAA